MLRRKTDPPKGILKTPVADLQRYRHERYHPSPDLELYVEHFWVVEWDLREFRPIRTLSLPLLILGGLSTALLFRHLKRLR